jgi:hypothetical protein
VSSLRSTTPPAATAENAERAAKPVAAEPARPIAAPRVLFFSSAEPDVASGTPVIVCDMLAHFPPGDAELLCEKSYIPKPRRRISLAHRVRTIRFPFCLWPFRRGSRVRSALAYLACPWLVLVGCWRVLRFRPDCLVAIYYRLSWAIAAYLVSRICRVPLVYYVHDTVRENYEGAGGLKNRLVAWAEKTMLRGAHVMVLHPYLADHYRQRYGIECTVLRQVIGREPRPAHGPLDPSRPQVIGFSGAIYENNERQLAELSALVAAHPRLRLKIWTDANLQRLAGQGIGGNGIEIGFESDYQRLLEQLSECDLLYLPLAFVDSATLTTGALQYAFPTKSVDYLLAGPAILVHCPTHFELSRFFSKHECAHVLNEGAPEALAAWLDAWLAGRVPPTSDAARRRAVKVFSPEENRRILWNVMAEVISAK